MVRVPLQKYRLLLLSIVGLLLAVVPGSIAQVFFSDFNSGVPSGASIPPGPAGDPNEARVNGGFLKLTDAANGAGGIFYIDDFGGGAPVKRFTASFKAYLFGSTCCGGGSLPADGFSFNLAPAASVVANPAYGQPAEEGLDSGLAINFDTWDNGGGEAPSVEVKWLGQVVKRVNVPVSASNVGATTPAAAERLVKINLDEDGTIDVLFGNTVICQNVATGYDPAVIGAPKWVFGARTGGANDNHWIDDLSIITAPSSQLVIAPQGSQWAFNDETLAASNLHGTGWQTPAYSTNGVAGWKTGQALFGNDSAGIYDAPGQPFVGGTGGFLTPLNRGSSDRATFYFRTKFNWSGSTAGVTLTASNWVDDGMVAYLNGVEVSRIRMPDAPAPIEWATLGGNPPTEGAVEVRTWDASALVQGENVVAVEVHQSSLGSSDVAFGMSLAAVGPLAPTITDPFQPTNRVVLANRETVLTVAAIGSPAVSYQWYKDGSPIDGATSSSYLIPVMGATDAGDYFCRVSNTLGSVDSRTAVVGYNNDSTPPAIVEVVGSASFDKATVLFNELLDSVSAQDTFNYSIAGSDGSVLNVLSATISPNGTAVTLTTDPQTPDTVYTVTATLIKDAAGNELASASADFRSWVPGPGNGVLMEVYNVSNRGSIDDLLTAQPNFPNNPRLRVLTTGFDSRLVYADDANEDYAGRLRGLFIPPVSGRWIFFMRSDDPGRLYFNPTGPSAAGKVQVGNQPGCCNAFSATGAQTSQPYELTAGKGYYVELLWREYGGGDYGQVAVALVGEPVPTVPTLVGGLVGAGAAPVGVGGPVVINQQPANTTVLANTLASFSVQASNPNDLPIIYQWRRNGVDIPGATLPSYSFGPVSKAADDGAVFSCQVSVIGSSTVTADAVLTVEEDVTPPTIVAVKGSTDLTRIVVTFSEFVEANSANDNFNYTVNGSITVQSAVLGADGKTVTLKVADPLTPGTDYTLNAQLVKDLSNNELAAANVPFRTFSVVPGFALTEIYQGIGGVAVADLTGNAKYPSSPDLVRYKGLFELNTFDEFENYGARMSGYLQAPVSGKYNFYMSSDDGGAFFLSTDMNPANLVQVASEPVWNGRRDWLGTARRNPAAPENRSTTLFPDGIELVAGQMYYFEALVKEGGGGDNLAVNWQMPGAAEPASGSVPISGIYMSSLADPSGANLQITQQPTDQVFVIANDVLANENFNAGNGGFSVETPEAFNVPWAYDAGIGGWIVRQDGAEVGHPMTSRLTSPEYTITKSGGVSLRFAHRYSFEGGFWDGGVIQVSVNGGDFVTVPGASVTQNGYTGTVLGNSRSALAGQAAFVLDSPNHAAGNLLTTVAGLGSFSAGDKIRVRFLYAGDTNTRGNFPESWQIDSFQLNQGGGAAQSVTFAVGIAASKAGETTPTTFFQWMRDNGDGAGFQPVPGANGPSLTFTPILADNGAKFKCQIYIIGANATTEVASLRVATPNTPPRFTGGPSQTVNEDAGPQVVPGWATDIIHHSVAGGLIPANFDTVPAGAVLGGNTAVTGGILHLTDAVNSQQSSFATPASPVPVDSMVVTFKARIGGGTCCGDRTADGWSITIGDVAVPVTFPIAAEEGAAVSSGFAVNFDSWDNGGLADDDQYTAPNVDVKVGGTVIAYQAFTGVREGGRAPSGPFITDPATGQPMSYKTGNDFVPVRIQLDPDGTLDVEFKGVKVVDNVQTGLSLPLSNARIAFGARTGGANDNHWIDDLLIVGSAGGTPVAVYPPQSAGIPEQGQTVAFIVSNDNPSLFSVQPAVSPDGTLTYTPAANANGVANVTVVAKDNGGTEFGGIDTSAPQTFTITVTPVNDCPTVGGSSLSVDAGASVSFQLSGSDVEGDALTYLIASAPAHGTVVLNAQTGAGVYTPAAGYSGPDSFSVTTSDGQCASAPAAIVVTVREVNRCPTAVAKVQPNIVLSAGQVETVVISSNGTNACLSLDGTQSSDPDGDPLTYTWVAVMADGSTVPLASGATATACLEVGTYTVRLVVDDGRCSRSADVAVEIITAGEAIDELIERVNGADIDRKNKRPFIASLKAAVASFDRGSCISGYNQLNAFTNKVRAQLGRTHPTVAAELIKLANDILAQIDCPEQE